MAGEDDQAFQLFREEYGYPGESKAAAFDRYKLTLSYHVNRVIATPEFKSWLAKERAKQGPRQGPAVEDDYELVRLFTSQPRSGYVRSSAYNSEWNPITRSSDLRTLRSPAYTAWYDAQDKRKVAGLSDRRLLFMFEQSDEPVPAPAPPGPAPAPAPAPPAPAPGPSPAPAPAPPAPGPGPAPAPAPSPPAPAPAPGPGPTPAPPAAQPAEGPPRVRRASRRSAFRIVAFV
jgi:hypothetical protein